MGRSARSLLAWVALGSSVGACGSSHGSTSSPTSRPASFETLIAAGTLLLRQGNTNAAQQLFQQATEKNPDNAIGYYDMGVAYQQGGRTTQALQSYREAVGHDSRYVPALYNEATIVTTTDAAQAMVLYRRVIAIQPDAPTALLNLGLLEATANQTKQAIADLRQAIKLEPSLASRVPVSLRETAQAS
jgi:Tfp pilus assembly protein PilF